MAQILPLGISHYPPLSSLDADMANILRGRLADPGVPAAAKDPARWRFDSCEPLSEITRLYRLPGNSRINR